MVITCRTCQKEEKKFIWFKYLIYAVLRNLNFVVIYALFPPIFNFKILEFIIKKNLAGLPGAKGELKFFNKGATQELEEGGRRRPDILGMVNPYWFPLPLFN